MSDRTSVTLEKYSAELTGDAQAMARLVGRPLADYPDNCWLYPSHGKATIDGRQQSLRNWLWEALRNPPLGEDYHLEHMAVCPFQDCVNPKHHARVMGGRRGRKPGEAPSGRTRSAVDVAWPDAQTILMLLVLGENAWPKECRDRCWNWTGPIASLGVRRIPRLNNVAAHKAVWELFNRSRLPPKARMLKVCGNDLCVNPTHLVLPIRLRMSPMTPTLPHVHDTPPPGTSPPEAITLDGENLGDLREDLLYMLGTIHRQEDLLAPFTRWLLNRRPDMHDMIRSLAHQEAWLRKLLVEDIRWTFL